MDHATNHLQGEPMSALTSAMATLRHYALSTDPDQRTSMADARTAICLASGVHIDDIDPSSGYNYSRSAYDRARRSWMLHIRDWGLSDIYDRPHLDRAFANWAAHRPAYTDGDDWAKAGSEAHYAHLSALGRPCDRESCDLCTTATA